MKITDLLTSETIDLNASAKDKTEILNQAVLLISKSKNITDIEKYQQGVFAREKQSSTGVGEGIAIPHCKSNVVTKPQLAAMVIRNGVDFDSLDGEKVQLLFLIAAPDTKDNVHLDVLARLSTLLMHEDFKSSLLAAKNVKEFIAAIDKAEQEEIAKQQPKGDSKEWPKIVCVTGCPTGIAHTYMAQEALEKASKEMGISIKVETRGQEPKNVLTDEEIEHAEGVIISADITVPMERFHGKKLVSVGTSKAIKNAKSLIEQVLSDKCPKYKAAVASSKGSMQPQNFDTKKEKTFTKLYKHLLNGLSHMIPFVVAGGILMSISYIIDRCCGVDPAHLQPGQIFGQVNIIAMIFNIIGANVILGLMIPILAGYISYSIAGKQGLVAGFSAGICATTIYIVTVSVAGVAKQGNLAFNFLWFLDVGMHGIESVVTEGSLSWLAVKFSPGFFGGLFGGYAAGYITLLIRKGFANFQRSFQGVRDILLIPLLSALGIMVSMLFINAAFTYVTYGINKGLTIFTGAKGLGPLIVLGILLAAVCALDMGGPISKAAHLLTIDWLAQAFKQGITSEFGLFATRALGASIAGSMVPPICLAFACWLFPQKFSENDRKPAVANLITGIFGITEGAIPYCIANPKTWIATITGSSIAGICSILFDGRAISPEGGTIAFGVATSVTWTAMMSFVAVIIGSVVAALLIGVLYKDVDPQVSKLGVWKGIPFGIKDAKAKKHALDVKLASKDIQFNELAFYDYQVRINSIKDSYDTKLNEAKSKLSKEKYEQLAAKYELKKKKLDEKIEAKRLALQNQAEANRANFNKAEFDNFKKEVENKKVIIDQKEAIRLKKIADKKAAKEAKEAAKEEKRLARLAEKQARRKAKTSQPTI